MNHTWKNIKYYEGIEPKEDICTVCGCIRSTYSDVHNGKRYFNVFYSRSNIAFDKCPNCIIWNDNIFKTDSEKMGYFIED